MNLRTARLTIWAILAALFLLIATGAWRLLRSSPEASFGMHPDIILTSTKAFTSPDFHFDAQLDPAVGQVGDEMRLELTLSLLETMADWLVIIHLPQGLEPDLKRWPETAVFQAATQIIKWQPGPEEVYQPLTETFYFIVANDEPDASEQLFTIDLDHMGEHITRQVPVWIGRPPQGDFELASGRVAVGQPLRLVAETGGSEPIKQRWYLGDGRVLRTHNPTIIYPEAGSYEILLTLSNPLGEYKVRQSIEISPEPAAYFRINDTTPQVGQFISLTSLSGGEPPLSYHWDFGDGSFSTQADPTHQYLVPGTYELVLTVQNTHGQARNHVPIRVGDAPTAEMVVPETAQTGALFSADAYLGESVTRVLWQMGDGRVYEGESISHRYAHPGDYFVTLVAYNEFGSSTYAKIVRVSGSPTGSLTAEAAGVPRVASDIAAMVATPPIVDGFDAMAVEVHLEPNPALNSLPPTEQLLWYINEARRQAGVNSLVWQADLSRAAQIHAQDMAVQRFTGHTGSDGSRPYERVARTGYQGGYVSETTAWGFDDGYDVVSFWLESPPHRATILSPASDQVGLAQTTDVKIPTIWCWTVEFASSYGSIVNQMRQGGIRWLTPGAYTRYQFSETVVLTWDWSLPLQSGERFVLYLEDGHREVEIAEVNNPLAVSPFLYGLEMNVTELVQRSGSYEFLLVLENYLGEKLTSSSSQPFVVTGRYPTAVPTITVTPSPSPTATGTLPSAATATPSPSPTATATPLPAPTATLPPTGTATDTSTAEPTPIATITETAVVSPVTATPTNTPTLSPTSKP